MRKTINRPNKKMWMITTAITTLFVVIGGYLLFFSTNAKFAFTGDGQKETPTPIVTETVASEYEGISLVTELSKDEHSPFTLTYPKTSSDVFNAKVVKFTEGVRDHYLEEMNNRKKKKMDGELTMKLTTIPTEFNTYSFVLETSEYTGGANSLNSTKTFHFNVEEEKELTIKELFENEEESLAMLSKTVRSEIKEDESLNELVNEEELKKATTKDWKNFSNFALTDEALILYFDQYAFTSRAAGIPTVTLPLENLVDYVTETYQVTEKVYEADPSIRQVALTFDDGPHPTVTRQVLETLKKYNAKATFFLLGQNVEQYPDIVKEIDHAGHELGNHSWSHPNLVKFSTERIYNELENTSIIIEKTAGKRPTVFRPPYGSFNEVVKAQTKLPVILWDVDTLDWKHRNPNQLLSIVQTYTSNGSNILMHDIHQSTADGLDSVLAYLQEQGYKFVTVSELEGRPTAQ